MPALIPVGGGPPEARCKHCGEKAVGPCATCRKPVCGDCCVLTEGGVTTYAICLGCDRDDGRSLSSGWWTVIGWIAGPMIVLLVLVLLLGRM